MTTSSIDHALVMDTDHIPGRGGYALVGVSRGVSQAERRFVADHFGISDYLHRPANARMYFSFFRVPDGRYAFVRRFVNGTRRNGVQSRVFVHTLFLDASAFEALHGLPWLLADVEVRPEEASDWMPLAKVIDAERADAELRPLQWRPPSIEEAHASLRRRFDALTQFAASTESMANSSAEQNVAAAAASLQRAPRLELPQGPAFEQLTLLTWSMLPIDDRAVTAWTQHHDGRAGGVVFRLSNSPQADDASAIVQSTAVARRIVAMSIESAASWGELVDATRRYGMTWGSPEIDAWLEFRESQNALVADPLAADDVLLPRLNALAESVRVDHRDPWVNELTILQFLWRNLTRSVELGMSAEAAVERWATLAVRSGVGRVIFREPPPIDWLDASEKQVGADLLTQFFLQGAESYATATATRATLGRWILDRSADGLRVSAHSLARLAVLLALDRSAILVHVLTALLERADGFRALRSAIQDDDRRLNDAVLLAILTGLRLDHADTRFFAKEVFLPRAAHEPAMVAALAEHTVVSIGESLRQDGASFVRFAFLLPEEMLAKLMLAVDGWLVEDSRAWRPLGRAVLQHAQAEKWASPAFARLAFTLAAQGESSESWLPTIIDAAKGLDRAPHPELALAPLAGRGWREAPGEGSRWPHSETVAAFVRRAQALAPRFEAQPAAAETLLAGIREHARQSPVGASLRSLFFATRAAWAHTRPLAAQTLETIMSNASHRAAEWESALLAFIEDHGAAGGAALAKFWQRLSATDVAALNSVTIQALQMLGSDLRAEVVKGWTSRVMSLPKSGNADKLLDTLHSISPSVLRPRLEIEVAMREIAKRIDTPRTYARLDLALQAENPKKRPQLLVEAMERRLRDADAAQRAVWLIQLFAAPCTLLTTQHVIEQRLLPDVARKLTAEEWLSTIDKTKESLFVLDYFLQQMARHVAAAKAHDATRLLLRECMARDRHAGIDAIVVGSRGKVMPRIEGAV